MASAFAHRLFTRGHVKYVSFHGDLSSCGGGFFAGEEEATLHSRLCLFHIRLPPSLSCLAPLCEG